MKQSIWSCGGLNPDPDLAVVCHFLKANISKWGFSLNFRLLGWPHVHTVVWIKCAQNVLIWASPVSALEVFQLYRVFQKSSASPVSALEVFQLYRMFQKSIPP